MTFGSYVEVRVRSGRQPTSSRLTDALSAADEDVPVLRVMRITMQRAATCAVWRTGLRSTPRTEMSAFGWRLTSADSAGLETDARD